MFRHVQYNKPEKGHPSVGEGIFIRASAQKVARSRQHNLVNLSAKLLEFHLSPARPQISFFILFNLWKDQVPGYFVKEMLLDREKTR